MCILLYVTQLEAVMLRSTCAPAVRLRDTGYNPLPPALKKEAIEVKRIILDVLDRASKGDF